MTLRQAQGSVADGSTGSPNRPVEAHELYHMLVALCERIRALPLVIATEGVHGKVGDVFLPGGYPETAYRILRIEEDTRPLLRHEREHWSRYTVVDLLTGCEFLYNVAQNSPHLADGEVYVCTFQFCTEEDAQLLLANLQAWRLRGLTPSEENFVELWTGYEDKEQAAAYARENVRRLCHEWWPPKKKAA